MKQLDSLSTGWLRRSRLGVAELQLDHASYGAHGKGAQIHYTIVLSPWGTILLAATTHGLCWLGIHGSAEYLETELRADLAQAETIRDDAASGGLARQVMAGLVTPGELELPVDIRATRFQLAVWRELCAIPVGTTRSYGEIARRIGRPEASRAVGHANGANPIAILIPCHRAIGSNGNLTGYRWGLEYKRRLLEVERTSPQPGFAWQQNGATART